MQPQRTCVMSELAGRKLEQWSSQAAADWAELGSRILEAAEMAAATHEALGELCVANDGAVVERPRETDGWKTHDLRTVAIGRRLAGQ